MGSPLESCNTMLWLLPSLLFLQSTAVLTNEDDYNRLVSYDKHSKFGKFKTKEKWLNLEYPDLPDKKNLVPTDSRDSWQNKYIPRPLLLNERFRNPKFLSRHPKRNKAPAHANILNTNYKHAFLAKMRSKARHLTGQETSKARHLTAQETNKARLFTGQDPSKAMLLTG